MKIQWLLLLILGSGAVFLYTKFIEKGQKTLPLIQESTSPNKSESKAAFKPTEAKLAAQPPKSIEVDLPVPLEDIESAIVRVESEIASSNAIERLNQNTASEEERIKYLDLFKTRDRLNEQKLTSKLTDLNQKISDLEKDHASRLETYGIKHDEKFQD